MKRIFVFMTLLLLVVACAPQQVPQQAVPAPALPQPSVIVESQATLPDSEPQPAVPEPVASKELKDLLSRADQKVKSYKYLELILPDKKQPDTISVKGNRIKIKLYEYDPYLPDDYFDTIYIDTSAKTVIGMCENRKRCLWSKGDNTKRTWNDLSYDQYLPKTPYQWLKEVPNTAKILGPELHENRETAKIGYTDSAGREITMWVDVNYGIPLEVWVTPSTGDTVKYKFNDVLFNTLTDADVTPPN